MLKVAIVGATGYTGEELLDILKNHPEVKITYLSAKIDETKKISEIFPKFLNIIDLECKNLDIEELKKTAELVFLAVPHGASMEIAPSLLKSGKKVIDLSADYRLRDTSLYKKYYQLEHKDSGNLAQAVYGLPELYRKKIKDANLLANPGCYPTGIILGCAPLVSSNLLKKEPIIIDSKSGITGAGRGVVSDLKLSEVNENLKPYKIGIHQHTPEITQELSKLTNEKVEVFFTPHLVSIKRGILSTIYLKTNKRISQEKLLNLYLDFYKDEPFVRILPLGQFPQLKEVSKTNYCDIGVFADEEKSISVVISAIDNLVKGAAGQAVQNMNIMYGFEETTSLI